MILFIQSRKQKYEQKRKNNKIRLGHYYDFFVENCYEGKAFNSGIK